MHTHTVTHLNGIMVPSESFFEMGWQVDTTKVFMTSNMFKTYVSYDFVTMRAMVQAWIMCPILGDGRNSTINLPQINIDPAKKKLED